MRILAISLADAVLDLWAISSISNTFIINILFSIKKVELVIHIIMLYPYRTIHKKTYKNYVRRLIPRA